MRVRYLLIALLAIGVVGGAVWLWQSHRAQKSDHTLVLYGNVDIRQVELAFNGSERIAAMLMQEGDKVKKGQLLATLDMRRLQHTVERAKAQVEVQIQVVARLEAGSRPEEIRKARADVEAAAAEAAYAERTYHQRIHPLAKEDVVSEEKVDNAKTAADAAQARLQAAKETLELALIGPRKDIAAAKATLDAYEAELALAQRELADASLYAPADGVIQDRILEPGDMASPQRPVYTLALTDPLWVRTYVSEPDLGKIRLGMAAEVHTDSYPDKQYQAWIGFLSPTAEFTPKSVETREVRTNLVYQVRVYVCNPQDELRLGMPATVTLSLDRPSVEGANGPERCKAS